MSGEVYQYRSTRIREIFKVVSITVGQLIEEQHYKTMKENCRTSYGRITKISRDEFGSVPEM